MKKNILKSILFAASICLVVLSSCEKEDAPLYGGPQQISFESTTQSALVNNDLSENIFSVPIWSMRPSGGIEMNVSVAKNTAGSKVQILTDLTKLSIPGGKTGTAIELRTSHQYVANEIDTIDFALSNAYIKGATVVEARDTVRVIFKRYCATADNAALADWTGGYLFLDDDDAWKDAGITMSHIAGTDTVVLNNSATFINYWLGGNWTMPQPMKICMKYQDPNNNVGDIPIQRSMVYGGAYWVESGSKSIFAGRSTEYSPFDNCDKIITIRYWLDIRALSGSAGLVEYQLKKKP